MQADHQVPADDRERGLAFIAMSVEDKQQQHLATGVVKHKRTKRPHHHSAPASPASSSESTTTEEEDMAHCLILLAQGAAVVDSKPKPSTPAPAAQPPVVAEPAPPPPVVVKSERYTSRKYTEAATTADGVRAGFYVYECKTCNKCFPTFQALGGHRASHKKPRLAGADEENANTNANATTNTNAIVVKSKPPMTTPSPPPPPPPQADAAVVSAVAVPDVTTVLSLNNVAAGSMINKLRVHECSICGAEFGSGQALGGHMRRHRPLHAPPERAVTTVTTTADTKKEGSASINLELDLNLPAPSDEESVSPPQPPPPVLLALGGHFDDGKKPILQITASTALVGCHY